jgi:hypothetical protein
LGWLPLVAILLCLVPTAVVAALLFVGTILLVERSTGVSMIVRVLAVIPGVVVAVPAYFATAYVLGPLWDWVFRLGNGRCPCCGRLAMDVKGGFLDGPDYVECRRCGARLASTVSGWQTVGDEEWVALCSPPPPQDEAWAGRRVRVMTREGFADFVDRVALGSVTREEWLEHAVEHYFDEALEDARRRLVREVIDLPEHGQVSAESASRLRALAQSLRQASACRNEGAS